MAKLTVISTCCGTRLRRDGCGGPLILAGGSNDEPCCCGECCIEESFFITGISRAAGACPATVYGQKTITRPACSGTGPVRVEFSGSVDDELIVNGVITEPGLYPFTAGCNGAHSIGGAFDGSISIIINEATFTIAAGDNHGANTGYSLKICFKPV